MAHIEGIVLDVIGLILQQNLIGMFDKGFQSPSESEITTTRIKSNTIKFLII